MQKLQKKNTDTVRELTYHPVADAEVVRSTIARITNDYRQKKKSMSDTYGAQLLKTS